MYKHAIVSAHKKVYQESSWLIQNGHLPLLVEREVSLAIQVTSSHHNKSPQWQKGERDEINLDSLLNSLHPSFLHYIEIAMPIQLPRLNAHFNKPETISEIQSMGLFILQRVEMYISLTD